MKECIRVDCGTSPIVAVDGLSPLNTLLTDTVLSPGNVSDNVTEVMLKSVDLE